MNLHQFFENKTLELWPDLGCVFLWCVDAYSKLAKKTFRLKGICLNFIVVIAYKIGTLK